MGVQEVREAGKWGNKAEKQGHRGMGKREKTKGKPESREARKRESKEAEK